MAGARAASGHCRRAGRRRCSRSSTRAPDDTTNAVNIRRFFARTSGVATTERTAEATVIQTRHRIPERALTEDQILVHQVPQPSRSSSWSRAAAETLKRCTPLASTD